MIFIVEFKNENASLIFNFIECVVAIYLRPSPKNLSSTTTIFARCLCPTTTRSKTPISRATSTIERSKTTLAKWDFSTHLANNTLTPKGEARTTTNISKITFVRCQRPISFPTLISRTDHI